MHHLLVAGFAEHYWISTVRAYAERCLNPPCVGCDFCGKRSVCSPYYVQYATANLFIAWHGTPRLCLQTGVNWGLAAACY